MFEKLNKGLRDNGQRVCKKKKKKKKEKRSIRVARWCTYNRSRVEKRRGKSIAGDCEAKIGPINSWEGGARVTSYEMQFACDRDSRGGPMGTLQPRHPIRNQSWTGFHRIRGHGPASETDPLSIILDHQNWHVRELVVETTTEKETLSRRSTFLSETFHQSTRKKQLYLDIWSMNFRRSPVGSAPAFQRIMHPHPAGRSTPRAKGYERRIAEEPTEFPIPNGR